MSILKSLNNKIQLSTNVEFKLPYTVTADDLLTKEVEQEEPLTNYSILQKITLDDMDLLKLLHQSDYRYQYKEIDENHIEFERQIFEIINDKLAFADWRVCDVEYIPTIIQILADLYKNHKENENE